MFWPKKNGQNMLWPKILLAKTNFGQNFDWPKTYWGSEIYGEVATGRSFLFCTTTPKTTPAYSISPWILRENVRMRKRNEAIFGQTDGRKIFARMDDGEFPDGRRTENVRTDGRRKIFGWTDGCNFFGLVLICFTLRGSIL